MILHETRNRWFPTLVSELLLPREFGVDLTGKDRRGNYGDGDNLQNCSGFLNRGSLWNLYIMSVNCRLQHRCGSNRVNDTPENATSARLFLRVWTSTVLTGEQRRIWVLATPPSAQLNCLSTLPRFMSVPHFCASLKASLYRQDFHGKRVRVGQNRDWVHNMSR